MELAQAAEGLWRRRYGGRWLSPGRALRPLSAVPPEPLQWIDRWASASHAAGHSLPAASIQNLPQVKTGLKLTPESACMWVWC
jgi:hypothetical protein